MNDLNHIVIGGRATRNVGDKDYRSSPSGLSVLSFSVAVNSYKRSGEKWVGEASYFDVKAFGKLADSLRSRLRKGLPVVIEGRLKQERWQSQDGSAKSAVRIFADRAEIVAPPQKEAAPVAAGVADGVQYQVVGEEEFPDDAPF